MIRLLVQWTRSLFIMDIKYYQTILCDIPNDIWYNNAEKEKNPIRFEMNNNKNVSHKLA